MTRKMRRQLRSQNGELATSRRSKHKELHLRNPTVSFKDVDDFVSEHSDEEYDNVDNNNADDEAKVPVDCWKARS